MFTAVVNLRRRIVQSSAVRAQALHLIGVSLDLGGNRRGVDMGPSAFRIAGLAERLTTLGVTVVDEGDLVAPIPEVKSFGNPKKKYIREIARLCDKLYRTSLGVLERAGLPLVLGGDHSLGRRVGCGDRGFRAARRSAARPHLGRRPRRHEYARELGERERARHAPGVAARLRADRAGPHRRLLAEGRARAYRPHRRPEPGRPREGDRARVRRPLLHHEGHRSIGHRVGRRTSARARRRGNRAASMSRSTSTSATRRSRPASARRSRAASTTAKRTC